MKLTESNFLKLMNKIPNHCETRKDDKIICLFSFWSQIKNKFSISYHLQFPQNNMQFNFHFDRNSYINSHESVSISCYDRNQKKPSSKHIFKIDTLEELEEKINSLFTENNLLSPLTK